MAQLNDPKVTIEEVISVITPAPGVPLEQVIADARITGAQSIVVDCVKNQITVTWYSKPQGAAGG